MSTVLMSEIKRVPSNQMIQNLNAQLLQGYRPGVAQGDICIITNFPRWDKLSELGYVELENANKDEYYFKALTKWVVDNYQTSSVYLTYLNGIAIPNSVTICHIVYHSLPSEANQITPEYPRTLIGRASTYMGHEIYFGFRTNEWYYYKVPNTFFKNNSEVGVLQLPDAETITPPLIDLIPDGWICKTREEVTL